MFDYDHLKKSYIPSYTRYWDDQSKVPFLFNPSTGIWISYDDITSISLKSNYIKESQLGGTFFWELSSDRQGELVSTAYNVLSDTSQRTISPTISTTTTTSTCSVTTEKTTAAWEPNFRYSVDDEVTYDGVKYRCRLAHTSLVVWMPKIVPALWLQIES
ncbi:MAG: hypothetical protein IT281_10115 [Ignavibacteria bacterium]|nr:hypothetical protein [Ignavibacteria bacterium]